MTPALTPPQNATATNPAPSAPVGHVCSHCGSDNIRESSTRRGMDLLPSNIGKDSYRCRACRSRFYLKREGEAPTPAAPAAAARRRPSSRKRDPIWKHPSLKRHRNEISIGVGSLVAFAAFLYLLARSGIAF